MSDSDEVVVSGPARKPGPPRARLTLRVGVTGHRPNKLGQARLDVLRARIAEVLKALEAPVLSRSGDAAYDSAPPVFRVLSALAEGADRVVAEVGLESGFELQCILPFPCEEYERDFQGPESVSTFRGLLGRATAVFELNGARANADLAYLASGRSLVRQCDALIAVWDGEAAAGLGGAADIVNDALDAGVLVIRIDSRAPHTISVCGEPATLEELCGRLRRNIAAPDNPLLRAYFNETWPKRQHAFYRWFEKLVLAGRKRAPAGEVEAVIWPLVKRHFEWADTLAMDYAARCRSAGVRMHVCAWMAVTAALVPILVPGHEESLARVCAAIELFLIVLIGWSSFRATRGEWHMRWLSYRSLAELLRILDFLAMMGRTIPEFRPPLYQPREDSQTQWVDWQFRAVVRELGLQNARADSGFVLRARERLRDVLKDQADFHERTAERCHLLEHRVHLTSSVIFVATGCFCLAHFLVSRTWPTFATAMLPALGAALAGISAQGEFRGLRIRSLGMRNGLREIRQRLEAASRPLTLSRLGQIAEDAATVLISEVHDWRALFGARPVERPG